MRADVRMTCHEFWISCNRLGLGLGFRVRVRVRVSLDILHACAIDSLDL